MSRRNNIPDPKNTARFAAVIKERLELISGERGTRIKPLPYTANTDDIINKINEILELLQ